MKMDVLQMWKKAEEMDALVEITKGKFFDCLRQHMLVQMVLNSQKITIELSEFGKSLPRLLI